MKSFEEQWLSTFNKSAKKYRNSYEISMQTKYGYEGYLKYFLIHFGELVKRNNYKVLDYGCGPGVYCQILASLGNQVYGCDFSPEMINAAKAKNTNHNIRYKVAPIYKLPYKDGFFDVIVCIGVFQTVENEKFASKELFRVLKDGGFLFINTLNRNSLTYKLKQLTDNKSLKSDYSFLKRYDPLIFQKMLSDAGFTNLSVKGVYYYGTPRLFVEKLIMMTRVYLIFNYLFRIFQLFSHSFLVIGRRKEF